MSELAQREKGGAVVRLLHKMRAIEETLRCCDKDLPKDERCRPCDVAVVAYLCSHMDNETGECIRKYQTIAKACGMVRSALVDSLKRLEAAGIIRRHERHEGRIGRRAYTYRLGAAPDQGQPARRIASEKRTSEVRKTDLYVVSPDSLDFPGVQAIRRQSEEVDWGEWADWLCGAGKAEYSKYGHGWEALAVADLDRWRREKGDREILAAIARARDLRGGEGLYGKGLLDYLESTYSAKPRPRAAT